MLRNGVFSPVPLEEQGEILKTLKIPSTLLVKYKDRKIKSDGLTKPKSQMDHDLSTKEVGINIPSFRKVRADAVRFGTVIALWACMGRTWAHA